MTTCKQVIDILKVPANPANVTGMARKRNPVLNRLSVETASEIQKMDAKSARWIAADTIRELTDRKAWYRWQKTDRKGRRPFT